MPIRRAKDSICSADFGRPKNTASGMMPSPHVVLSVLVAMDLYDSCVPLREGRRFSKHGNSFQISCAEPG